MAIMIPDEVSNFTNPGEKQVYDFLKRVTKPDDQYIVWYSPDVNDREPDFLLYNHDLGIIILEVKSWLIDKIIEASPGYFKVWKGHHIKYYNNPIRQAKGYSYKIKEKIENDGFLVNREGRYLGKSKIPISYGVVFTDIFRNSFVEKNLDEVIDIHKAFFLDDLSSDSEIVCDETGNCFRRIIQKNFPPIFPCQISDEELPYLKQLLYPIVLVCDTRTNKSEEFQGRLERLRVLDNHQESFVKELDGGHRLIKGASGTGKSIILVHKAVYLQEYNPEINSILILCYNLTLSNCLRRMVFEKGGVVGQNGIEVWSFYEFCGKILKEDVDHDIHEDGYYEAILEQAMEEAHNQGITYDAILIDEGQDFSDEMLAFVKQLINPETDNFTLVLDENQNIYRRKQTWKKLGFNFAGNRSSRLKHAYRSSIELNEFVSAFLNISENMAKEGEPGQLELFPGHGDFNGPPPFITQIKSMDVLISHIINEIKWLAYTEAIPLNQISIIYTSEYFADPNSQELIDSVINALNANGFFYHWVSEDSRAKLAYDVSANSITLTSIHSIKGFDHSCVFLLGLDMLKDERWTKAQIEMMTYVAITRVRDRLYIPYIEKTELIDRLLKCNPVN